MSARGDVQGLVIAPMLALGAKRRKGMCAADFKRGCGLLCEMLGYLTNAELESLGGRLCEEVRKTKEMPAPLRILDLAEQMRPDPMRAGGLERVVRSMMRSAAGRIALDRGHAVEMLEAVRGTGHGFKVSDFHHNKWAEAARKRREAVVIANERNDSEMRRRLQDAELEAETYVRETLPPLGGAVAVLDPEDVVMLLAAKLAEGARCSAAAPADLRGFGDLLRAVDRFNALQGEAG